MSSVYLSNTTGTTLATSNVVWVTTTGGTTAAPVFTSPPMMPARVIEVVPDHIVLSQGKARTITFPDGTVIKFAPDGSFKIEDEDAKVVYKAARVRDFNPFINASDKLEDFIKFCGSEGIRQGDMLGIPIKYFVQWLVIEAARADGEPTNEVLLLPAPRTDEVLLLPAPGAAPRCLSCGRFISRKLKANRIEFCRALCFDKRMEAILPLLSSDNGLVST